MRTFRQTRKRGATPESGEPASSLTSLLEAGACYGALPLGAEVAECLAQRYGYPFPDRDLVRVAQYAAIQSDPNAPKEDVVRSCKMPALPSILSPLNLA